MQKLCLCVLNGQNDTIRTSDSNVFKAKVQAFQQKRVHFSVNPFILNGRDDTIRTCDPFVPSEVRYQAALHPENPVLFRTFIFNCQTLTGSEVLPLLKSDI